jgi:ubiquinone/menaquinone biosynthesis C-methylase UbiE
MVDALRRRASAHPNIDVREMDAEALDFPDASFDAVTCGFGLMFFPNPARALAEMRRVLIKRGRFALSVWGRPDEVPFLAVAGGVFGKLFPKIGPM